MSGNTIKITDVEGFLKKAAEMPEGFLFAMFTDKVWVDEWPMSEDKKRKFTEQEPLLLEARVFSEGREDKLFRGDIGRVFYWRCIEDSAETDYFDEEQYLDIDEKRSKAVFEKSHEVQATGGGRYFLPLADYKGAKVLLRNYIDYYEQTGQAYVKDWRLVRFFQEKAERSHE